MGGLLRKRAVCIGSDCAVVKARGSSPRSLRGFRPFRRAMSEASAQGLPGKGKIFATVQLLTYSGCSVASHQIRP